MHQHHLFIVAQNIANGEEIVQPHQKNPYAYTKYVNECQFKMSGLHNIGLRFLQYRHGVRPDMALYDMTKNIVAGILF